MEGCFAGMRMIGFGLLLNILSCFVLWGFDLGRWAEAELNGVLVDRIKCLGTCEVLVVNLGTSWL